MILFNNHFIERDEAIIDIEDRGYQFGDGVYEVIRVYNGNTFQLDKHMERLERSVRANASRAGAKTIGRIEDSKGRVGRGAPEMCI